MSLLRNGLLWVATFFVLAALPYPAFATGAAQPWATLSHASFRHHTDGPMTVGTALAQDRTGFIWLGTADGLVRWDGLRLRRYVASPGQAGALPGSVILSLLVDGQGRLWVGTSNGGLARYDAAADRFAVVPGTRNLPSARIASLADDGQGGVWVGASGGLLRLGADGTLRPDDATNAAAPPAALAGADVDAVLRDRSGRLWVGTTRGLFHRSGDGAPWRALALPGEGAAPPAVSSLYQDAAGRVWIGTRSSGAFVLDQPGFLVRPVLEGGGRSLRGERVFSFVEKNPGVMWIGTEGGGILEVDAGGTRRIKHIPDVRDSLRDDEVRAMLRARNGLMFVATIDALSQHDPVPQGVATIRTTGLGGNISLPSVMAHPDGRVWLAIAGGAVEIIDPASGGVRRIPGDGQPGHLPGGRVLAMVAAPDGTVLLGSQHGLYRCDADGGNLRRVELPGRSATSPVWALAWHRGMLWLGGLDGVWAVSLNGKPAVLRHEEASLGDSRVTAIVPLANGDVWVGMRAGAARLVGQGGEGRVELLPIGAADPHRLPPGYISSIVQDKHGRLWFANYNGGVSVLQRVDAAGRRWFRHIGEREGLPADSVNALVPDVTGRIWLSTDHGIASIDPDTYRVHRLSSADGVQVRSYWTGAGARSTTGDILFGGLSGLTVVRPGRLQRRADNAPFGLTKVTLGGREQPFAPFNGIDAGAGMPALTVAPADRARGFAVEFALLDFAAPELHRYAYRLRGYDRDWIEVDNLARRISYTSLAPGDYTLQLRAMSDAGGSTVTRQLAVRALPAWYQQGWLHALLALGALGTAFGLVHVRTSLMLRRQRELQTMVEARTAELQASHAQLEQAAYSDSLTGLPNRRRFNDELARMALAAQEGEGFALILVDLDHFKAINDTLGHDAGDALLVAAAGRLGHAVRDGDLVARLGGDEFAVLVWPATQVDQVCQRIVGVLGEPVTFGEHRMQISASVGAAAFVPGVDAVTRIYKAADEALYASKGAGRNGWRMAPAL